MFCLPPVCLSAIVSLHTPLHNIDPYLIDSMRRTSSNLPVSASHGILIWTQINSDARWKLDAFTQSHSLCAVTGNFPPISGRQFYPRSSKSLCSADTIQANNFIQLPKPMKIEFSILAVTRSQFTTSFADYSEHHKRFCLPFFYALACHKGNSICLHSAGCKRLKYGRMTFPNLSRAKHKSVRFDSIKQRNVLRFNLAETAR